MKKKPALDWEDPNPYLVYPPLTQSKVTYKGCVFTSLETMC
jgi:hypothetical protein